ncbi:autotransporter domain-containing protein [Parasphingopyxis sp. CP4]|uniref:copper resistance protein B n=1 Tax=Parasphingopyxis sp. CP4 TaxID=2724527 RepID=UPI0015A32AAC|nr:copper resistance protein B [Parasphingopyxis sp. CP4]QLC22417.1 autotransporter domain-containing protein [Parasphingopyxis sp. CP4]
MSRLIAALLLATGAPALAQHQGHGDHGQMDHGAHQDQAAGTEEAADPHAGHAMPEATDPHGGHAMPMQTDTPPDPHAGHAMPAPADPHAGHQMMQDGDSLPQSGPPPEAFSGPDHAADMIFPPGEMAEARAALLPITGGATHHFFGMDRLEAQIANGEDGYVWESNFWIGGDIDKLWIKTEGEGEIGGDLEEAEIQALWSHAIGPFFDLQAGIRYDLRPEPDRAHAVIGVQGLAPYFFEIDAAMFVSDEGDVTARVEAEYDQRLTQRLIAQPRIELNLSAQDIAEIGIGSGVTDLEAGLRLRYEISPQFAPYVGLEWQKQFGDTADFTRAAGGDADRFVALVGLRFWF